MSTTPLFIITGLSGAGKTTTSKALRKIATNFYVFDMDILVENQDFQKASCQWMTIARYNSLNQKPTVLLGAVPEPYNLEACKDFQAFKTIHTALLHCHFDDRYKRLRARGGVWTPQNILSTIEKAERHYKEAQAKGMTIINTSLYTAEEVAIKLNYWVEDLLQDKEKEVP
ncbi:AAA family ATPase [Rossellomorea marisflavi]|uniref:AAA family ATPase n=1 Tax=Rossellomorea marisflavi TaxID=189381 RepID=UPI003511FF64